MLLLVSIPMYFFINYLYIGVFILGHHSHMHIIQVFNEESTPTQKLENMKIQITPHTLELAFDLTPSFLRPNFLKSTQKVVPQLRTFHMDLHPPTHDQLKIPMVDIQDMLRLSVMQIFKSIGNHLHIRINTKTCLGYVAPKLQR